MWALRLRPSEKALKRLRWDALRVMLAIDEPSLGVFAAVHIGVLDLSNDVASSVCRARVLRSALPPINVDEAVEAAKQLEAKLLEVRRVESGEVRSFRRCHRSKLRPLEAEHTGYLVGEARMLEFGAADGRHRQSFLPQLAVCQSGLTQMRQCTRSFA